MERTYLGNFSYLSKAIRNINLRVMSSAKMLFASGFVRSAAALCSSVLEQHFERIRLHRQIKISKKNPGINDYNKAFTEALLYDFRTSRQIQFLAELKDLRFKNKKIAPSTEDVSNLIAGTEKILNTVV